MANLFGSDVRHGLKFIGASLCGFTGPELLPPAERQLRKLDASIRRRIQAAIELLAQNPHPPQAIQRVGGAGEWHVRTGDYRIIHEILDDNLVVPVLRLGYHREISESR